MNSGVGNAQYFQTWYTNRDWRFYRMFLADILQHAEEPGPILDVGAGLGYFVEAAQRWRLDCVGLEGSADAVQMGAQRFPGLRVTRHALSEPFPFDDGHFAAVLFNQVIEHLEPDVGRRALAEILRVLRPNGMLVLLSPSRYNEKERREDPTHIHMYSPRELRSVLEETGFSKIAPFDEPLDLLGTNRFGRRIMRKVFQLLRWDQLSGSANARAFKRGAT